MFDSFKYKYLKVGDKAVSNRLYHVNDSINASIMSDDIDDEGTYSDASETINSLNNYGYDEIGNLQRDSIEGIKHIEWTAYGKIKSIVRRDGYFKTVNGINVYPSNLEFLYDAMGNRIAKIEKPRDTNGEKSVADWKTTYYILDSQGNTIATYKKSSEIEAASYKLIKHPIYGLSRVGIDNFTVEFVGYTAPSSGLTSRVLGLKQYELTNHLGNVLTTISDKKIPVENNGVVDHFVADISTVSDYYPFGSPMDGRTFSSEKYRFGFNGQEAENEISGMGNYSFFKYRISDNRLGRFFAVDPLSKEYPWNSNYAFSENRVLDGIELEGLEWVNAHTVKLAYLNRVLLSKPDDKKLFNQINREKKQEELVNNYLSTLKQHDELLYNYIDNLIVTDFHGNTQRVPVNITADSRLRGNNGQTAQTNFAKKNYKEEIVRVFYNGNVIAAPMSLSSGMASIGFDVIIYNTVSFGDTRLANESGDVMYWMEYNLEAFNGKSNATFFEQGGGGWDAYKKSESGKYSDKVEELYKKRKELNIGGSKKGSDGIEESGNPYPLQKE